MQALLGLTPSPYNAIMSHTMRGMRDRIAMSLEVVFFHEEFDKDRHTDRVPCPLLLCVLKGVVLVYTE